VEETSGQGQGLPEAQQEAAEASAFITQDNIPVYEGRTYVPVNGGVPGFTEDDLTTEPFEIYGELDSLGRCTAAYANICEDLMPTQERGSIRDVKPSGWHSVRYDDVIPNGYLFSRSHLIAFQLAGENANPKNLITGTYYMNAVAMLPFEEVVGDYVRETGNHVLYRVTPVFEGDDLLARGIQMEAMSVEDKGRDICFNIFVFNIQPGISLDYATGESFAGGATAARQPQVTYYLNHSSRVFHMPSCEGAAKMKQANRLEFTGGRADAVFLGYDPCPYCHP
jgi:DNA-entry nuclease